MKLASHNSWSYHTPKTWWMKLIGFTAKCQDVDIITQYRLFGVRCFDLRVKFENGIPVVVHNIVEYDISEKQLSEDLVWLNSKGDVSVRILLDIRNSKEFTQDQINSFVDYCEKLEKIYKNIEFWCGRNLYNWNIEYPFKYNPSCEEKYASVCPPKLIDDWYPRWFAKENNKEILSQEHNVDFLMIDFVNYQ